MKFRCHAILILGLAFSVLLGAARIDTDIDRQRDLQVKAAMLIKLPMYISWPDRAFENATDPFIVVVIGRDPFGAVLDHAIEDQTAGGRSFTIKRFASVAQLEEEMHPAVDDHADHTAPRLQCQIVWLCESERRHLSDLRALLRNEAVLTVAEYPSFAEQGGVTELYHKSDGRVGFRINRNEGERAGLKFSAQLLKLATIVTTREETP